MVKANHALSNSALVVRACLHGVGGPQVGEVSFFCFHALGNTKQKKLTPLDLNYQWHWIQGFHVWSKCTCMTALARAICLHWEQHKARVRTSAEFSHEHNILNISHPNKPKNCQKCSRNHPDSVYRSQVFDCKARVFRFSSLRLEYSLRASAPFGEVASRAWASRKRKTREREVHAFVRPLAASFARQKWRACSQVTPIAFLYVRNTSARQDDALLACLHSHRILKT